METEKAPHRRDSFDYKRSDRQQGYELFNIILMNSPASIPKTLGSLEVRSVFNFRTRLIEVRINCPDIPLSGKKERKEHRSNYHGPDFVHGFYGTSYMLESC